MAATRQIASRSYWVFGGVAIGIGVASILALFASALVGLASHIGEELFHAIVLFTATSLICWSTMWMKKNGKQIVDHAREISDGITREFTVMHRVC